ncbi:hypothetical protein [Pseudokineococcus sp. 1T1Z-3]|uniref:hypothetical protein n=1 Tax=Pseudokineococcus sp. 1T1Z-3 TaxID=3132745 RepID=UPI00309D0B2B
MAADARDHWWNALDDEGPATVTAFDPDGHVPTAALDHFQRPNAPTLVHAQWIGGSDPGAWTMSTEDADWLRRRGDDTIARG